MSTHITLRFKHSRVTVLLLVDPLTPISSLKIELLEALRERYPLGLPASPSSPSAKRIPIPATPSEIKLALPIDNHDVSKGWKKLDLKRGSKVGKACPKILGIKDAGVLAFRFQEEAEKDDDTSADDDEDEYDEKDDRDEKGERSGEKFVVEWSSYDDDIYEQQIRRESMDEDWAG